MEKSVLTENCNISIFNNIRAGNYRNNNKSPWSQDKAILSDLYITHLKKNKAITLTATQDEHGLTNYQIIDDIFDRLLVEGYELKKSCIDWLSIKNKQANEVDKNKTNVINCNIINATTIEIIKEPELNDNGVIKLQGMIKDQTLDDYTNKAIEKLRKDNFITFESTSERDAIDYRPIKAIYGRLKSEGYSFKETKQWFDGD